MTTILHVSDIHCGWPFVPEVGEALIAAAQEIRPEAVVVSGDLVQRADFAFMWEAAREFLRRLPKPLLVVPGNHDIPLFNPLKRLIAPFAAFRKYISEDLDPILETENLVIVGINTSRRWTIDLGYISGWQLDRMRATFDAAPRGALRVIAMHHPLLPQKETGIFPRHHVYGHRRAIRALAEAGADIVLSGHNHYPKAKPVAEYVPYGGGIVFAQAGTATSKRLRPASGFDVQYVNVVRATPHDIAVEPWSFRHGRFSAEVAWSFRRHAHGPRAGARVETPGP